MLSSLGIIIYNFQHFCKGTYARREGVNPAIHFKNDSLNYYNSQPTFYSMLWGRKRRGVCKKSTVFMLVKMLKIMDGPLPVNERTKHDHQSQGDFHRHHAC